MTLIQGVTIAGQVVTLAFLAVVLAKLRSVGKTQAKIERMLNPEPPKKLSFEDFKLKATRKRADEEPKR